MNISDATLEGVSILVTRPAHQADDLCSMIRQRGGKPVEYPLFEIKAVKDTGRLQEIAREMDQFNLLVFVSRNAVQYGLAHFKDCIDPQLQTLLAVGKSTAAELVKAGFTSTRFPKNDTDSEGLLALPELQNDQITGRRVLIVRGVGGRELLTQILTERGAQVEYAEVYERVRPCYDAGYEQRFWQQHTPDIVLLTSCEAVENLLQKVPAEFICKVMDANTVVMSNRVANFVRDKGFRLEPAVVDETDDQGLIYQCEEIARSMQV